MKGLFPEFDNTRVQDFTRIWKDARFVFDTNVLLNLYRYQTDTREALLKVLDQLSDQIWIPHHVGLEFQRNRLKVVAEQSKRVSDARRAVNGVISGLNAELEKLQLKKRQSLIDPEKLIQQFEDIAKSFSDELDKLPQSQQRVNAQDPLREKLENVFDGHIGPPPASQEEVDRLYQEAGDRYKFKIPPGYEDADKDKNDSDVYTYGGILYKRKFGDFIAWRQVLSAAKEAQIKSVVFVTDDGKEDWWWRIEQEGSKTIGPRPELIEEASKFGVEAFLMYSPENFLKFAGEVLKSPVSEATLAEVRDVSQEQDAGRATRLSGLMDQEGRALEAVERWLLASSDAVVRSNFPDSIAIRGGEQHGYELKLWAKHRPLVTLRHLARVTLAKARGLGLDDFTLIFVVVDDSLASDVRTSLVEAGLLFRPSAYKVVVGQTLEDSSGELSFIPFEGF